MSPGLAYAARDNDVATAFGKQSDLTSRELPLSLEIWASS